MEKLIEWYAKLETVKERNTNFNNFITEILNPGVINQNHYCAIIPILRHQIPLYLIEYYKIKETDNAKNAIKTLFQLESSCSNNEMPKMIKVVEAQYWKDYLQNNDLLPTQTGPTVQPKPPLRAFISGSSGNKKAAASGGKRKRKSKKRTRKSKKLKTKRTRK